MGSFEKKIWCKTATTYYSISYFVYFMYTEICMGMFFKLLLDYAVLINCTLNRVLLHCIWWSCIDSCFGSSKTEES
jgi:hypothetical protein